MKQLLIFSGVLVTVFSISFPSDAQPVANQSRTLKLYPGQGQTLDFRGIREKVRKVWLDDPSRVTIDFDDANCALSNSQTPCAANVIHLRRIKPITFSHLPTTDTPLLTIVTDQNLYSFQIVFPNSGRADITPIRLQSNQTQMTEASTALILKGLQAAETRGLLTRGDLLWNRVQLLVQQVEQGVQMAAAANQVGVSPELVTRLVQLGRQASARRTQ